MNSDHELYYQTYNEAFEAYLSQRFTFARKQFLKTLSLRPDDPASKEMIARIDTINTDDLPPNWDGSIALTMK